MRAYELMVIFKADTEESAIQTFMNRLGQMAKEAGGSLEKLDKWGVRRFTHEMRKTREGFYVVAEFVAPNALTELDRTMRLADEVIRHKFLRLPLDEAHRRGLAGATA
jgi:small subunit ribosomal protein S6